MGDGDQSRVPLRSNDARKDSWMKSSTMLFAAAAIALGGPAALAQPTTGSGTTPATPASPATPATPAAPATPATPAK